MAIKQRADVLIEPIADADEMRICFDIACTAFGTSGDDALWAILHYKSDTAEGRARTAENVVQTFETARLEKKALRVYLKATIPVEQAGQARGNSHNGTRVIAGFSIWDEMSMTYNPPSADATMLKKLYEGHEDDFHYASRVYQRCFQPRIAFIEERAREVAAKEGRDSTGDAACARASDTAHITNDETAPAAPDAVMVLDLLAVHPSFQGRGVSRPLVQWGLDRANVRGELPAILEASPMGRRVYARMGFDHREQITFGDLLDPGFSGRPVPDGLFMHTGKPQATRPTSRHA